LHPTRRPSSRTAYTRMCVQRRRPCGTPANTASRCSRPPFPSQRTSWHGRLTPDRPGTGYASVSRNDPKPGQPRLHLPGDKTSRDWRSRQDGLHLLAQGAFAGIRNPATHSGDERTRRPRTPGRPIRHARWANRGPDPPSTSLDRQIGLLRHLDASFQATQNA
jgi:hypothetical protein